MHRCPPTGPHMRHAEGRTCDYLSVRFPPDSNTLLILQNFNWSIRKKMSRIGARFAFCTFVAPPGRFRFCTRRKRTEGKPETSSVVLSSRDRVTGHRRGGGLCNCVPLVPPRARPHGLCATFSSRVPAASSRPASGHGQLPLALLILMNALTCFSVRTSPSHSRHFVFELRVSVPYWHVTMSSEHRCSKQW